MEKVKEAKTHVLQQIRKGNIGCETMNLYNFFSARTANTAIKELLDEGQITISSPVTGYRLNRSDEYGVAQALSRKSFDARKNNV